jgi:pimeloyl-ACP methyl ester carboxylesterase
VVEHVGVVDLVPDRTEIGAASDLVEGELVADPPVRDGEKIVRVPRAAAGDGKATAAPRLGSCVEEAEMARFVFVHGAFGGAWCWEPVLEPLEAAGHTTSALDLPGGGEDRTPAQEVTLEGCAERVCAALAQRPEPAVLVGYSMGGVIITQAAGDCPDRVQSLVFVAAFMPANGQSLLDLARLPEGQGDLIQANVVIEGDPPVAVLSAEATAAAVYNDCTSEQTAWAIARRRPQPVAPYATPVRVDDRVLEAIPRSYVLTRHDRALMPALQRRMIREHPCEKVIELDADHAPYLSATDGLAAALLELAGEPVPAAA